MAYDDSKIKEAAHLFIYQGLDFVQIEQLDGFPTRQTLSKYAKEGRGNNGIPWQETRQEVEKQRRIDRRAEIFEESRREFANLRESAKFNLIKAARNIQEQLETYGDKHASSKDLVRIYDMILKLEAGTTNEIILDVIKEFLTDVGKGCMSIISDDNEKAQMRLFLKETLNKYSEKLDPVRQLLK